MRGCEIGIPQRQYRKKLYTVVMKHHSRNKPTSLICLTDVKVQQEEKELSYDALLKLIHYKGRIGDASHSIRSK